VFIAAVGFVIFLYLRSKLPDRFEHDSLPSTDNGGALEDELLFEIENPLGTDDDDIVKPQASQSDNEQAEKTALEVVGDLVRSVAFVGLQPIKIIITYIQVFCYILYIQIIDTQHYPAVP
jgi:hypothetical protein